MVTTSTCVVCGSTAINDGLELADVPASHVILKGNRLTQRDFGNLNLVECLSCSHVQNVDLTAVTAHPPQVLTNATVSPDMTRRHRDLVAFLSPRERLRVSDCRAGSGALSVAFASAGHRVTAIEPNLQTEHTLRHVERVLVGSWPVPQLQSENLI